ncbi:hypothetical protein BOTBODRAFT_170275 [Botryobasidium botryosum FD-172 SS1]|uniref:Atos-like conserved domain-containing protein n=1 Tax=Botryobasidium botryosum (strain FD-172 SS1) TaxID=930990 RepID=A0A067N011_BOTB1|nr:hypothetical protein BOTBODRAFT_170275 [Botryobasidium botryosum FD-172 SS1]
MTVVAQTDAARAARRASFSFPPKASSPLRLQTINARELESLDDAASEAGPIDIKVPGSMNWRRNEESTYDTPSQSLASSSTSIPISPTMPRSSSKRLSGSFCSSPTFVGSYTSSLLSGRMPTPPSPPVQFSLSLGVLGSPPCPASLRCPPHLHTDFGASWYEIHGPYVGAVDLDAVRGAASPSKKGKAKGKVVGQHGYRVPPKGQIQLLIKNGQRTAVKVLLMPYDLADMPCGSKTFLRQMWYGASDGGKGKEVLRYAVHLQFVSPPARVSRSTHGDDPFAMDLDVNGVEVPRDDASGDVEGKQGKQKRRIYLTRSIRLVFASRTPDSSESIRIVREEPGVGAARYFACGEMDELCYSQTSRTKSIGTTSRKGLLTWDNGDVRALR